MARRSRPNRIRADGAVDIVGLAALQRTARQISQDSVRELRVVNKKVADMVANRARLRALSLGPMQAAQARSIAGKGEQRYGLITYGGARYPYAMGANFGAYHNKARWRRPHTATSPNGVRYERAGHYYQGWNQFPEWTGNQHLGGSRDLILFHTIRRLNPDIIDKYDELLADYVRRLAAEGI